MYLFIYRSPILNDLSIYLSSFLILLEIFTTDFFFFKIVYYAPNFVYLIGALWDMFWYLGGERLTFYTGEAVGESWVGLRGWSGVGWGGGGGGGGGWGGARAELNLIVSLSFLVGL